MICFRYDAEKAEFDKLKEQFEEQERDYRKYMREKEEEEKMEFAKRYVTFMKNRAARRIQRCWRRYRERKMSRKKGKGKEKKRKQKMQIVKPKGPKYTKGKNKNNFD